jgi:uncharacterized protein
MRLKREQAEFLKQSIQRYLQEPVVYLFGSRVYDHKKGGDIDILVIGEKQLTGEQKREIKIKFYKAFGLQKIDIVSFDKDDPSTFKELALLEAEML